MFGIGLGELVLIVCLFCLAAWLITAFVKPPYQRWGYWALGVFGIIYILERLHVFDLLQKVQI